jgi:hypothetical protein
MERLFHEGMEHLRAARWDDAISVFTRLREMGVDDPELEKILAEAQLKAEIARAAMPAGALPPAPPRPAPKRAIIGLVSTIVLLALVAIGLWKLQQQPPMEVAAIETPSPKPDRPAPQSEQPAKPSSAKTSSLLVRMASSQSVIQTTPNLEIILDASGSMLGKIGATAKIDIAHSSIDTLLQRLPDNTNIALRSYGHRRTGDCTDIDLVAPFAPLDRASLMEKVRSIRPINLSRTPIEQTLRQAAEDIGSIQNDVLIILVSDGDETCGGDPAKAAADLRAAHPNVRVSVIGFGIGEPTWQQRLRAIAEQGGGDYFDAADAAQLADALQQAVQITYRVVDARGHEVFSGPVGSAAESLPVGEYAIEVNGSTPFKMSRVRVSGTQTTVELRERGGTYVAQVLRR